MCAFIYPPSTVIKTVQKITCTCLFVCFSVLWIFLYNNSANRIWRQREKKIRRMWTNHRFLFDIYIKTLSISIPFLTFLQLIIICRTLVSELVASCVHFNFRFHRIFIDDLDFSPFFSWSYHCSKNSHSFWTLIHFSFGFFFPRQKRKMKN